MEKYPPAGVELLPCTPKAVPGHGHMDFRLVCDRLFDLQMCGRCTLLGKRSFDPFVCSVGLAGYNIRQQARRSRNALKK